VKAGRRRWAEVTSHSKALSKEVKTTNRDGGIITGDASDSVAFSSVPAYRALCKTLAEFESLMIMLPPVRTFCRLLVSVVFGIGVAEPGRAETLADLQAREARVREVVARTMPFVVALVAEDSVKHPGSGSGVLIGKEGYILTAAHVTEATRKALIVVFPDGRRVKATALGANRGTDAALVKISDPGPWEGVELGSSDTVRLGDWCLALGHPGGFSYERRPPVRLGRVWRRDMDGALFTSCPLIGGDSGGPVFDLEGRVIGINSSIHGNVEMNRHVAIDTLRDDWDRLLQGKAWGIQGFGSDAARRPKTGATFDREGQDGVKIDAVGDDSPAARAGLKMGDRITAFEGAEIRTFHALMRRIGRCKAGDKVKLSALRGDAKIEAEVELAGPAISEDETPVPGPKIPEMAPPALRLGLALEDTAGKGAKVLRVEVDGLAAKAGLVANDIIIQINATAVDGPTALAEAIRVLQSSDAVTLKIQRGETTVDLTVNRGAPPASPP
jgi:serine protease Do